MIPAVIFFTSTLLLVWYRIGLAAHTREDLAYINLDALGITNA